MVRKLHHFPIVRDVVLHGSHGARVADDHDRHARQQQRFDEDADALIGFGTDLFRVFHQLVHRVGHNLAASGAIRFVVHDIAHNPIRFGDVFSQHVSHAGSHHAQRRGFENIDVA